jgi:pimeloyl-ACP methyl ester carboxylesterase
VLVCHPCFSVPSGFRALGDELARDHRVVLYDARGTGGSSRRGPYDIETDVDDLVALLDEIGERLVLIAFGDALHRSVEAAVRRTELVQAVVVPGVAALGPRTAYPDLDDGLASSPAVVGALVKLLETDYRSGLRTAVEGGNPQFSEEEVQARIDAVVAYSPPEATLGRLSSWIRQDSRAAARALGERLWVLSFPGNVWFPEELIESLRTDAPEARVEFLEDGAVSRPDLTAGIVRRITRC